MVSTATTIACVITLFMTLVFPVIILAVYAAKNKGQGVVSAWFLGAAGFFVTQILIRVPILTALSATEGFAALSNNHPLLFTFLLAFTAGLFELVGRFGAAKLMRKRLTYRRSLAAGLGHGGIEAMLLIGMAYVSNLAYIAMINSGAFDTMMAEVAATGMDITQLEMLRDQLVNYPASIFLLASLERLLTMAAHAAMSMIVCYSLHAGHIWKGLLLCLGIHTLLDTTTIFGLLFNQGKLSQGVAYGIIYLLLAVAAVLSILVLKGIRSRWPDPTEEAV